MLNRKSESLDLEEGRLTEQTIDVDAQRMRCEFGVEASAQTPEGVSVIDFNVELIGELRIHGFNHLPYRVVKTPQGVRQLLLLITTRNSFELNPILLPQLGRFGGANVGFIAQDL